MAERLVAVDGGTELWTDAFGSPGDPALLLVAGAAEAGDSWRDGFCERLAAGGRHVVRYDHRDTGRSTASPAGHPTYTVADLQQDVLRVLDGLDIERAHLVGVSMGGGMAQDIAARHPERLLSLTLIATSAAGERAHRTPLPPPEPDDAEYDMSHNHWSVITAGDDAEPFRMSDIRVPTLVLHGTADRSFPLPHGEALAAEIPGATLVVLDGMGHEAPPPHTWDVAVPAILRHTS